MNKPFGNVGYMIAIKSDLMRRVNRSEAKSAIENRVSDWNDESRVIGGIGIEIVKCKNEGYTWSEGIWCVSSPPY
jgi:hypothetical protein